jgi:hypothetical protein
VLVGTALCATLPMTSAAHAATTPTISLSFNGQAPGTLPLTVSGTVDVAITVNPVPGAPAQFIRYSLSGSPDYGVIEFTPGQCDTTCTVHYSLNTAALLPFETGGTSVPAVTDGSHNFGLTVSTAAGYASASRLLMVDNQRPTADTPSTSLPSLRGTNSVSWTVHAAVAADAPSGSTISDVELEAPGVPGLPITHFTKNADGTWTVTADTSQLAEGAYRVAAVATDSNGTVSVPDYEQIVVDHGFTLNAPQQGLAEPDWSSLNLSYNYSGWLGCSYGSLQRGAPTDVQLQVDGAPWQDSTVDPTVLHTDSQNNCVLPAAGTTPGTVKPLPFGKHTLTWVVTDNNGVKETATQAVTVVLPLTSDLPSGSRTLVAGSTLHLAPTVSAPDGFSKLASWSFVDSASNVLASGTGATPPSLTLPTSALQETGDQLTLRLVSDSGVYSQQQFSYQTGWQTAAFSRVSASAVKRGSWVLLSASDWVRVGGAWTYDVPEQATVQYQWETPGSNVWHNGPLVHIAGPQVVRPPAVWMRVGGNVCYRSVYTQSYPLVTSYGSTLIPATSAPVCVTAH